MENNVWFSSDNHWGHANIIVYSKRPFSSVEEMDEMLIQYHNQVVKPGDTTYFLGDFCFGDEKKIKSILNRLNGNKHLILGNHDKNIRKSPKNYSGGRFFASIQDYKEISVEGQKIILFHYGCRVWNKSHNSSWLLYGHSHGSLPPFGKSVDVGVDAKFIHDEYRPTEFSELKRFMDKQEFQKVDHHGMED